MRRRFASRAAPPACEDDAAAQGAARARTGAGGARAPYWYSLFASQPKHSWTQPRVVCCTVMASFWNIEFRVGGAAMPPPPPPPPPPMRSCCGAPADAGPEGEIARERSVSAAVACAVSRVHGTAQCVPRVLPVHSMAAHTRLLPAHALFQARTHARSQHRLTLSTSPGTGCAIGMWPGGGGYPAIMLARSKGTTKMSRTAAGPGATLFSRDTHRRFALLSITQVVSGMADYVRNYTYTHRPGGPMCASSNLLLWVG